MIFSSIVWLHLLGPMQSWYGEGRGNAMVMNPKGVIKLQYLLVEQLLVFFSALTSLKDGAASDNRKSVGEVYQVEVTFICM